MVHCPVDSLRDSWAAVGTRLLESPSSASVIRQITMKRLIRPPPPVTANVSLMSHGPVKVSVFFHWVNVAQTNMCYKLIIGYIRPMYVGYRTEWNLL